MNGKKILEEARNKMEEYFVSEAVKDFLFIINEESNNIAARKGLAHCYQILGEYDKAQECWEEVIGLDSQDIDALEGVARLHSPSFQFWLKRLYKAMEEVEKTNYSEARILLRSLLEERAEDISIYKLLGLTYYADGDIESSAKVWQQGLLFDVNNKDLKNYLTRLTSDINNQKIESSNKDISGTNYFLQIIATLKEKAEHYRIKKIVWLSLASLSVFLVYDFSKNFGLDTEIVANMAVERKPGVNINYVAESVLPSVNLVKDNEIAVENQKSVEANDNIGSTNNDNENIKSYNPEKEWELYGIGYNAFLKKDYEKAIQNLRLVVEMHSLNYVNREALYYLARTYYLTDCLEEAKDHYSKYLIDFPQSNYYDDSLYYLACVHQKQNDLSKARKYLKMLNEYDPNSSYKETSTYNVVMR